MVRFKTISPNLELDFGLGLYAVTVFMAQWLPYPYRRDLEKKKLTVRISPVNNRNNTAVDGIVRLVRPTKSRAWFGRVTATDQESLACFLYLLCVCSALIQHPSGHSFVIFSHVEFLGHFRDGYVHLVGSVLLHLLFL